MKKGDRFLWNLMGDSRDGVSWVLDAPLAPTFCWRCRSVGGSLMEEFTALELMSNNALWLNTTPRVGYHPPSYVFPANPYALPAEALQLAIDSVQGLLALRCNQCKKEPEKRVFNSFEYFYCPDCRVECT